MVVTIYSVELVTFGSSRRRTVKMANEKLGEVNGSSMHDNAQC